ncbi:MAG TPA: hypothetical protein VGQ33_03080, partial [Vicinamibacteria bacterium]|nr:hypothetical protein [Vicinamibacteria bacterium]
VRVDLTNRGGAASGPVTVQGELAGRYDEAKTGGDIEPGATSAARLRFPRALARPGVYPVVLLLEYAPRSTNGASVTPRSQRAFVLLTLGADAPVPVRLTAPDLVLEDRASLPVTLESADGRPHRVLVRVLGPRGLNAEHARDEVAVPAAGVATVAVPLLRGSVPRSSTQGLLLVAETIDGEVAQAATATTTVSVAPAADLLPPLRLYLIGAGAALLAAAAGLEWRHVRRSVPSA